MEWAYSDQPVDYPAAVDAMEARAAAIRAGAAREIVWLLEHPPLYTAGTSADPAELRDPNRFPVFKTRRGGRYTYHGPGQRIAYLMIDLDARKRDVRAFVCVLEEWLIATLAQFGVRAERRAGRVGVWVDRMSCDGPLREDKIAAIGVRISRWVTRHGVALNIAPDLSHFQGVTPCGVDAPGLGVTSLADLGVAATSAHVDEALRAAFEARFGATIAAEPPLIGVKGDR